MATAKKAPSKRVTPKSSTNGKAVPRGVPAERYAAFDTAAAEYEEQPIAFRLDGDVWDCWPAPTQEVVNYIRRSDSVGISEFVEACVKDRDGWVKRTNDPARPVPHKVVNDIYLFLIRVFFGEEAGKS